MGRKFLRPGLSGQAGTVPRETLSNAKQCPLPRFLALASHSGCKIPSNITYAAKVELDRRKKASAEPQGQGAWRPTVRYPENYARQDSNLRPTV